jgi:hypothetical protein
MKKTGFFYVGETNVSQAGNRVLLRAVIPGIILISQNNANFLLFCQNTLE